MQESLSSDRLYLIALSPAQLELCLDNLPALGLELGFAIPGGIIDDNVPRAINMKLAKLASTDRGYHNWLTYWMIFIKDISTGVGLIGFKGYPNDKGEAEIGYGINKDFRNLGFMTEAVYTLSQWAFAQPGCEAITATAVSNPASEKVLQKLGWRLLSQIDGATNWVLYKKPGQQ